MKKKKSPLYFIYLFIAFFIFFNMLGCSKADEEKEIEKIIIEEKQISMNVLDTYQVNVKIIPENATNKNLVYISSNERIVKVDKNGVITALTDGKAKIFVVANNEISDECVVVVTKNDNDNIILNENNLNLNVDESFVITVQNLSENNKTLNYSSSNENVAKVDSSGKIIGISTGTAIITVKTSNGKTAICKVVVSANEVLATTVSLNKTSLTLTVGSTATLTVTISPSNTTNKSVTWSSSDSSIAKVDSNGKISGLKAGIATITAKTTNGNIATCKVVVNAVVTNSYYGINVNSNGQMNLANTSFRAIGVNLFSTFIREMKNNDNSFMKDFDLLKKYDVPFVRIPFCGYDDSLMKIYDTNPNRYFSIMDKIVKYAEEKQIGLVIDFFWETSTLPYHNNEFRADYGNKNSKTIAYAKRYINDVVSRYKKSKAIWGYEIGNEYALDVDLYPSSSVGATAVYSIDPSNPKNYFTTNELVVFYETISDYIRSLDNKRFITTGDASARAGAYSLWKKTANIYYDNHKAWTSDFTYTGKTDYLSFINKITPNNVNTISLHLYKFDLDSKIGNFNTYLKYYVDNAQATKKAVFLGEFSGNSSRDGSSFSQADIGYNKTTFDSQLSAIKNNNGLQLAALWIFSRDNNGYYIVSDSQEKDRYRLSEIQKFNQSYKAVFNAYWN